MTRLKPVKKKDRETKVTTGSERIEITTKRERALFGLALNNQTTPQPSETLRKIGFLFQGSARIQRETSKQYLNLYATIQSSNPSLTHDEIVEEVFKNKKVLSRILQDRSIRSIYCQCIILFVSKWMKGVIKKSHDTIQRYAGKKYSFKVWEEGLLGIGPKFKRNTWANAMIVASNYVRHFEEWEYDTIEKTGPNSKDIKIKRKNFLKSLKGEKARKNVQVLIDTGVKEGELFGFISAGPVAIMEAINSEKRESLLINCEAWLKEVHNLTSYVVKNHPENDDSPIKSAKP